MDKTTLITRTAKELERLAERLQRQLPEGSKTKEDAAVKFHDALDKLRGAVDSVAVEG